MRNQARATRYSPVHPDRNCAAYRSLWGACLFVEDEHTKFARNDAVAAHDAAKHLAQGLSDAGLQQDIEELWDAIS
jgi:hypothetical protein